MKFRKLKADEIDCRVSTINEKGLSLLLYKDARVDQNILDETVGPMRWQRTHQLIGDRLYCTVEIFDKEFTGSGEWIGKQDVGTESYTEKEKGQASDSFKRACFNWGIGRELYTAPFIWVPAAKTEIISKNGKPSTYDRFTVEEIDYEGDKISRLVIRGKKGIVFQMGEARTEEQKKQAEFDRTGSEPITAFMLDALRNRMKADGIDEGKLLQRIGLDTLEGMKCALYSNISNHWDKAKKECSK